MPEYGLPCPKCDGLVYVDSDGPDDVACEGCDTAFVWSWSGRGTIVLDAGGDGPQFIYRGVGRFRVRDEQVEDESDDGILHLKVKAEVDTIASLVVLLLTQGGDDNFLILSTADGAYVQFLTQRGSSRIYGEAVADGVGGISLDGSRKKRLGQLGWHKPDRLNYYRAWSVEGGDTCLEVAEMALKTLIEIYGLNTRKPLHAALSLSAP